MNSKINECDSNQHAVTPCKRTPYMYKLQAGLKNIHKNYTNTLGMLKHAFTYS